MSASSHDLSAVASPCTSPWATRWCLRDHVKRRREPLLRPCESPHDREAARLLARCIGSVDAGHALGTLKRVRRGLKVCSACHVAMPRKRLRVERPDFITHLSWNVDPVRGEGRYDGPARLDLQDPP